MACACHPCFAANPDLPPDLPQKLRTVIDLYCERVAPGLLAEPVNAFTNLAFLIAAWGAWSLARRVGALSPGIRGLLALTLAIGVGSALFHTLATPWARALDEVPILLFQLWFIWLYARRVIKLSKALTASALAAYLVAAVLCRQYPHLLNGSLVYAPALLALAGLGLYHFHNCRAERWLLLAAMGVFIVSVACRSIDEAACSRIPIGTHFLWHLLNGAVLYLAMRALILARQRVSSIRH